MKNFIFIDVDTDREKPIIFGKPPDITPPETTEGAKAMILNDIACLAEAISTLILMADQNNYGKLEVYNKAGRSNFGIYNTSIVSTGTYQDVLTGVTLSDFYSTSGTYNSYIWNLIYDGTNLDLEITQVGNTEII